MHIILVFDLIYSILVADGWSLQHQNNSVISETVQNPNLLAFIRLLYSKVNWTISNYKKLENTLQNIGFYEKEIRE